MAHPVALTLIRHGKTFNNERNVYQGWLDSPLLPDEIERLERLSSFYPKPDRILSSDLQRCADTAKRLFPDQRIELNANFRELHFGDFEGKSHEQLKNNPAYQNWLKDPYGYAPANGESWERFARRLQKEWQLLHAKYTPAVNEIAIFTHGGVIRFYLERFAPIQKSFWEWQIPFGGGYRLVTTKERLRRNERCTSLSEVPLTEKRNG